MNVVGKIAQSMEAKDWTLGGVVGLLVVVNLTVLGLGALVYLGDRKLFADARLERKTIEIRLGKVEDGVKALQEWGPGTGDRVNRNDLEKAREQSDIKDDKLAAAVEQVSQNMLVFSQRMSEMGETLGRVDERIKFLERTNSP